MSTTPITVLDHAGFEVTCIPGIVQDEEFVKRDGQTFVGVPAASIVAGSASAITTTTGPTVLTVGAIADADITTRVGATLVGITRQALADALRTIDIAPASAGVASAATYTWTTAKAVSVTYAAGTCDITLPDETAPGLVNWPVGEARTLLKFNTSVNVIGFVALTNVAYNLAAVNTAITTLIGSATVPGIATGLPVWTIYRASAALYVIWPGI